MAKQKRRYTSQPPQYEREFCLQKEGTQQYLPYVVVHNMEITDDELMRAATRAARRCAGLYGGHWIAHTPV